ncbi:MAG: hypothetical protein AB7N65_12060 [Vicinamibacterales bacterium]
MLFAVRGTMVAATVAWAVGEIGIRSSRRRERPAPESSVAVWRWARRFWTVGVVLALVHAWLAFEYVYDWSHTVAADETLRLATSRIGVGWAGGIYVNYVFLAVWMADVCWWWLSPASHAGRGRRLETSRRAFFLFMFLNGSVVFASGASRIIGAIAVGSVLAGSVYTWRVRSGASL